MAATKTLPVSERYKRRLFDEKRDGETWEDTLERLTGDSETLGDWTQPTR